MHVVTNAQWGTDGADTSNASYVRACLELLFPVHEGKDAVPRNSTHILVIYFTHA